MADNQDTTVAPVATNSAPATDSSITENPTVSPAAETVTAPATNIADSKPDDAAASVTGSPEPTKVDSVLGEIAKPDAAVSEKKEDAKVEGEKPVDTKVEAPTEVKPELPAYEAFKLPENITLEKEPLDNFTKILGEIETGKLDHAGMQEAGQKLIDLAAKSTIDSITRLNDSYVQIHEANKKARFEALKSDPDLGGDKLPDTIATLQKTVGEYGGTEAQIAEFRKEVSEAGIDASPALCRLIYNMQQKINKYTTENDGNRIVPGAKPAPSVVKDYQRFYAGN